MTYWKVPVIIFATLTLIQPSFGADVIHSVKSTVDLVQTKVIKIDQRADALQTVAATINTKADSITTVVESNQTNLSGIRTQVLDMYNRIRFTIPPNLPGNPGGARNIITYLNEIDGNTQSAVSAVGVNLNLLSDKAVLIGDSIGALSNKVDGVAISLADVTTAAANGINNNINGLSATTVQIQADLETLALSSPEGLADRMAVIETKLSNLPATVQEQLGIDLGPDVTDEVLDGLSEIKKVVADQKNQLSLFGDGSPGDGCYNTRFEMKSFVTNLALISSMLQSVGESSIDFDVGDSSVIDNVPCKILYGISIAFQQTRMSDLVLKLEEAAAALETLIPLFVQTIEGESLSPILHSDSCETIVTPPYRGVITGAAGVLNAVSIPLQIWATKVDTETFTGFSDIRKLAPITKEVSGGVWGFANITLSREKSGHKLANGLNAVAKGLDALASSATNKIFKCSVTHNQSEIWAKLEMLEAESRIVKSQVCSMSRSRVEGC